VQLQRIVGLLAIGLGASSLVLTGCAEQTASNAPTASPTVAQESPSENVAQQSSPSTPAEPFQRDVVFVPTEEAVVEKMLELAQVTKDDVIYDLGSGDGRIVVTAAKKYGTRGVGVEIDPELVKQAQENAKQAGVSDRVQFLNQDLFKTDFSEASVVSLYLLPQLNLKLRPKILQLKPGTRVVSHDYDMGDWKPEQVVTVKGPSREHTVYFWRVPEKYPEELR
jgi:predicted methyltransferase